MDLLITAKNVEIAYEIFEIYTQPVVTVAFRLKHPHGGYGSVVEAQRFLMVSGQVGRSRLQPYRPWITLIEVVSTARPTALDAQNRVELLLNGKIYKYDMKKIVH